MTDQPLDPCPRCGGQTVFWGPRGANFYCWVCNIPCGRDFYLRNRTRMDAYPQAPPSDPAERAPETDLWRAAYDLSRFKIRRSIFIEFAVPKGATVEEVEEFALKALAKELPSELTIVKPAVKP